MKDPGSNLGKGSTNRKSVANVCYILRAFRPSLVHGPQLVHGIIGASPGNSLPFPCHDTHLLCSNSGDEAAKLSRQPTTGIVPLKAAANTVWILSKSWMFFGVSWFPKNTNFLLKRGFLFFYEDIPGSTSF